MNRHHSDHQLGRLAALESAFRPNLSLGTQGYLPQSAQSSLHDQHHPRRLRRRDPSIRRTPWTIPWRSCFKRPSDHRCPQQPLLPTNLQSSLSLQQHLQQHPGGLFSRPSPFRRPAVRRPPTRLPRRQLPCCQQSARCRCRRAPRRVSVRLGALICTRPVRGRRPDWTVGPWRRRTSEVPVMWVWSGSIP